ncbi:MAG: hypothetical protein RQ729_01585 [Wenzhouxiangellaceae bacterium]|nr:hypothetical protein [Wenzhouxiangellaceae bacterium]
MPNLSPLGGLMITVLLAFGLAAGDHLAAESFDPQPAVKAPLASQSLLLHVIDVPGAGFVAVGERGHVLRSPDGKNWSQAEQVPVRSTLTRATVRDGQLWAVGHDSTILQSLDAGRNWVLKHFESEASEPLFDILFTSPNEGIAIGAYGRYMVTRDGGQSWEVERIADRIVDEDIDWAAVARAQGGYDTLPDDFEFAGGTDPLDMVDRGCYEFQECHLNAVLELASGRLIIAAERGYGFRSDDNGETWTAFRFPYSGSMFGLAELESCVVSYGLRGHVQRSCDGGESWSDLDAPGQQTLLGDARVGNEIIMVGSGASRVYLDHSGRLQREEDRLGSDYAAVAGAADGLILVGEDGVRHEPR